MGAAEDWDGQLARALARVGLPSLHPWQREVLGAWRERQDCLVLSGTGSGKSICFQLPALLSSKPSVIISPLISLMRDQVCQFLPRGVLSCHVLRADDVDPVSPVRTDEIKGNHFLLPGISADGPSRRGPCNGRQVFLGLHMS